MKIHLNGQRSFENRGCEAIIRSTVAILRETFEGCTIAVPSSDAEWDAGQWPEHAEHGVEFVRAYQPFLNRVWVNLQGLPRSPAKRMGWPFRLPGWVKTQIEESDLVLSVGGDNYSLDYKFPSLLMGMDAAAVATGRPTVLWGASVGPFDKEPDFLPVIKEHLASLTLITVREDVSLEYLHSMGLSNVERVWDSAFLLKPEQVDLSDWPDRGDGVVGVNPSSLILRYAGKRSDLLLDAFVSFVRGLVVEHGMGILLVPHVYGRDGAGGDMDAIAAIWDRLGPEKKHCRIPRTDLNAAQTKYLISMCRFFVGARTHATIAAISSKVPCISIAYSIKARGINRDVFGSEDWLVDFMSVSDGGLERTMRRLIEDEDGLRESLDREYPRLSTMARAGGPMLRSCMEGRA